MTEYIIPIDDTALDYDEMFIGVIRKQKELVRCKDCARFYLNDQSTSQCRYSGNKKGYCWLAEKKMSAFGQKGKKNDTLRSY